MSHSTEANERLYDALAKVIDRAGPENEALLLTKLSLLLANQLSDEAAVVRMIATASEEIRPDVRSTWSETSQSLRISGQSISPSNQTLDIRRLP